MPLKVSAFTWKAVHEIIPTKNNLLKKGMLSGPDVGVCSLCMGSAEMTNHFLIICPLALLVWNSISNWLSKLLSFSSMVRDHFLEFTQSKKGKVRRKVVRLIWQSTI